ncbi:MAG: hypothetical protein Q8K00_13190 [Syntrophales bacterium]|nr:hypothetical protein [Syntrophales bacterium]
MKTIEFKMPDIPKFTAHLDEVYRDARRAGLINIAAEIEANAIKGAPVRTSNLKNSGSSNVNAEGTKATVTFSSKYAEFVHEGTGLYGPRKKKIENKRKITVNPKEGKPYVTTGSFLLPGIGFRKSIKGMHPNPFLTDAAKAVDPKKLFDEAFNRYLSQKWAVTTT